jgi:DNA-binding transcriptional MerR regulator
MTRQRDRLYSITELSRELGVTPRAIRFYESKGLLEPQRVGTTRCYTHRDLARMLIILRGKRLGFSLSGIKQYLDLYDLDPAHVTQLVHLLRGARQRIAALERQRHDLETMLAELRDVEQQTLQAMRERGLGATDTIDHEPGPEPDADEPEPESAPRAAAARTARRR